MDTDRFEELLEAAARMWLAAESVDALRRGDRAWQWTHGQVARLEREGRHEDPEAVREIVRVLEDRIEMERRGRRKEAEAER